jgi:arabinogalactan oligomer/maltooligosaccharide transport system substrate-binding protein
MSRSKIFILLIVVALLLGTVSSVFAQSTLVIWADITRAPAILALADQVEADLGITLEVVEIGFGDIRDQLLTAGPAGEGPDVLIGAHDWLGQLVTNGAVAPINLPEEILAELSPAAVNAFSYNGQLYGIPYGVENVALIRNVDLVPEAPATWQEVREISEQLQSSGTAQYGFLARGGDFYHNYPIVTAFGGYVFGTNEDGSYNPADVGIANEGGIAAAEWLSGMYSDGLMPADVGDDVAFALFEEGDAAMFITGPWFIQRIKDTGINYSIDPLPGAEGGLEQGQPFSGVQGFMISAFSENQLLAEIFLTEYVATTEFMQSLFELDPRGPAWLAVDTSSNPDVAAFAVAGANAYSMPAIPEMAAVWGAAGNEMTLLSQGGNAEETATAALAQVQEAIGNLGAATSQVTIAGSLQDELGCAADWDPACEASSLQDQGDGVWSATFNLPAGEYEYKATFNGDWPGNIGLDNAVDGGNIPLSLAADTEVTFTVNDNEKTVTDSVNNN